MSAQPLDLEGHVVGRQAQLSRLRESLAAADRRGGTCALVTGAPGVGKSTLLQLFGIDVSCLGGIFGYGRHPEGASVPYAAVGEALGALVRAMEFAGPAERDAWRTDLSRAVSPRMASALTAIVPGLEAVFGAADVWADDVADGRHRLWRVAARLVGVTASYRPVVLAVDDLQWADQDSLLLLAELLSTTMRNVLVVGTSRAGEFDPAAIVGAATGVERMELEPLSRDDVEVLLDRVCGADPVVAAAAAEFHRRTGGNPLQVRQLLLQAQRVGALSPPGSRRRSTWDLAALAAIQLGPDAPDVIEHAAQRLAPDDRAVLGALACIGGEFHLADARVAAARPVDVVARVIWDALDLRLLDVLDGSGRKVEAVIDRGVRYRFSHDRVAEAARAALSEPARREVHLRIGRHLLEDGDDRLFDTARHLGVGGLALPVGAERAHFAEVSRRAAELARRQASFPVALRRCREGLALLGPDRWSEHPGPTRRLHLAAAEAAFLLSDFMLLETLLTEAEHHLTDQVGRAHLAFLRIKAHAAQRRFQDALSTGLRALGELGHPLPATPGKVRLAVEVLRMKARMWRWSDDRLLALPRSADPVTDEAQLILDELLSSVYRARPELLPLIVAKQIELTTTRGFSRSAPVAICSYGFLLAVLGDYTGAQRFGEVAVRLTERDEFRDARPQTRFLYLHFIRHWRHPMHDGLPQLREAYHQALDAGEVEWAGLLAAVLLYQSFWAGRPLAEIDALARSIVPEIRPQPARSILCQSTQQYALNLMGRGDDPFLLAGESGYDEREVLPVARDENDVVALSAAVITKFGLHFWQGDLAGTATHGRELTRYLDGMRATSNLQLYHLINALSRIALAPGRRSTRRAVRRAAGLHRKWAAVAPANYAAPHELLLGVWARSRGHLDRAERHLDRAIALAEEYQLPLFGGLAHEAAAALYEQDGRSTLSRTMVRAAHRNWLGIGLVARVERLEREHPWLRTQDLVRSGSTTIDPLATHRLTQMLSAATTLEGLAEALLGSVARTIGADRVLLFTGDEQRLVPGAVHEAGVLRMLGDRAAEPRHDRGLVRSAARTGSPMLDAAGSPRGRRPAAIAVPLRMRDRTIGVVYAEHGASGRAFGVEHEDAVALACAQAASALWNLELESRLRQADEERRSLVEAQSRFIPREILGILDIEDIRRVRRGHQVERRMTVLVADIRGYTALLEGMTVTEASELSMGFLGAVELPIVTCNGLIQDVRGDEIIAVFDTDPDDAVRAGLGMLRSLRAHNADRIARGSEALRIGIGVNTGPVGLSMVGGVNRMALTVVGDAVNLASRVESATKRYGSSLLISEHTRTGLVDPRRFDIRRMERVMVVNRRQPVTLYEVFDEDPEPLRAAKRAARGDFDTAFACFDGGQLDRARAAFQRCRERLPDDQVAVLHLAHCEAMLQGTAPAGPVILTRK